MDRASLPDLHTHTELCGHSTGHPVELVRHAARQGLGRMAVACHTPMPDDRYGARQTRMAPDRLDAYLALWREARAEGGRLGVEVLLGMETEVCVDEADARGMDALLAALPLDFKLGSLHHQVPAWRAYWQSEGLLGDDRALIDRYFERLAEAPAQGRYHSLSHPDVIRSHRTVSRFVAAEHERTIKRMLDAVAAADICLEVNTSGWLREPSEVHPDPLILRWARERDIKLTLGSDSHRPDQPGQFFARAVVLLRSLGFDRVHAFRRGERISVRI